MELPTAIPNYFWLVFHLGPAALSVYHALLYKRDSRSAMGWIMACIFVPFAGPVAYFLFGINRVRSRAHGLRKPFYVVDNEAATKRLPVPPHAVEGSGIESAGQRITGRPVTPGNEVTPLHHGDGAYPAMIAAIGEAKHRVLLSTYIMKADGVGMTFANELQAAVSRGVEVKVLIDGVGELYSLNRIAPVLRGKNVEVARFLPPKLFPPSAYINLRTHRKLLVVDNQIGFAGGMNISDDNTSADGRARSISDIHFQLSGPVVGELAEVFYDDWQFATRSNIQPPRLPETEPRGQVRCRVVPDGPNVDLDSLALTIEAAISAATRSVDIMTPYFLPNRALLASLVSAILRGVRVRLVLPEKNNLWYVHWANRNELAELLQWNTEVYYQPEPFCHSKLLCVDEAYTLIGSANLDTRSLRLNFEVGIEVFSEALTSDLRKHFEQVISTSRPVTYEELADRSIPIRLRDAAADLFSPYM